MSEPHPDTPVSASPDADLTADERRVAIPAANDVAGTAQPDSAPKGAATRITGLASAVVGKLKPAHAAELEHIFSETGLLAKRIDGYRVRASQLEMARAVAAAMEASNQAQARTGL